VSQVARSRPLVAGTYRWLRWAAWSCLAAAGSAAIVVSLGGGSTVPDQILLPGLGLLFVVLTLRVVLAMVQWPHRRASLGALLAALLLWCAGSALLNGDPSSGVVAFPSPSESLFMLAAAGFAAFLVLDVERRSAWSASIWIDAIVLRIQFGRTTSSRGGSWIAEGDGADSGGGFSPCASGTCASGTGVA